MVVSLLSNRLGTRLDRDNGVRQRLRQKIGFLHLSRPGHRGRHIASRALVRFARARSRIDIPSQRGDVRSVMASNVAKGWWVRSRRAYRVMIRSS